MLNVIDSMAEINTKSYSFRMLHCTALHRSQIYRAVRARFDFACASKAWPGAYEYEVNRAVDSREASFSKFFAEV